MANAAIMGIRSPSTGPTRTMQQKKVPSSSGSGEEEEEHEGGDEEDQDANQMTEEELRALRKRCLRFFDVLILLCAAALCGGSLYISNSVLLDNIGPLLASVAAGVSGVLFAVNIFGLLSVCANNVRNKVLLTVSRARKRGDRGCNDIAMPCFILSSRQLRFFILFLLVSFLCLCSTLPS